MPPKARRANKKSRLITAYLRRADGVVQRYRMTRQRAEAAPNRVTRADFNAYRRDAAENRRLRAALKRSQKRAAGRPRGPRNDPKKPRTAPRRKPRPDTTAKLAPPREPKRAPPRAPPPGGPAAPGPPAGGPPVGDPVPPPGPPVISAPPPVPQKPGGPARTTAAEFTPIRGAVYSTWFKAMGSMGALEDMRGGDSPDLLGVDVEREDLNAAFPAAFYSTQAGILGRVKWPGIVDLGQLLDEVSFRIQFFDERNPPSADVDFRRVYDEWEYEYQVVENIGGTQRVAYTTRDSHRNKRRGRR